MVNDAFEEFRKSSQYSALLAIFDQVIYNQPVNKISPNTAYIYCSDVVLPEYDISTKKKLFGCNTLFDVNNSRIFQGTLMFYSKNQYLGCYNDVNNVLYLIDIITPFVENRDFNIIAEVIDEIRKINGGQIQYVKGKLMVKSKAKLMFADTIYDLTIHNYNLTFLDKILHRTPVECLRTNDTIYDIIISNEQNIGLESYKTELAAKAQEVITSYRQKYYEDTLHYKQRQQELLQASIPVPQFSPGDIAKTGLMIAVEDGKILYMFRADIKVYAVIDEKYEKYAKLPKPIIFDNGLIIIKATISGQVIGVKFIHDKKHYHTDSDNDVCLGSASSKITGIRINSLDDILMVKSCIVDMLSVCNTSSMYSKSYKCDEMQRIISHTSCGTLKKLVIDSDD